MHDVLGRHLAPAVGGLDDQHAVVGEIRAGADECRRGQFDAHRLGEGDAGPAQVSGKTATPGGTIELGTATSAVRATYVALANNQRS